MKSYPALLLTLFLPLAALACGGGSKSTSSAASPAATSPSAAAATPTQAPASTVSPPQKTTAVSGQSQPTPAPAATASASSTDVWDARAVWDAFKATPAQWKQFCNADSPVMVREGDPCVVQVMQAAGAQQPAIDFYNQNGYFIRVFTEEGRVDYARGAAPWINMGRDTQQLFLNGEPPLQELSSMTPVSPAATAWKQDARYAQIALANPTADPWTEYGELVQATTNPDGQRFELSIPILTCRACPTVAQMILDLDFDTAGHFKAASLGAPQPPKPR